MHPLLRTALIAGAISGAAATALAAAPWYFQPRTMTRALQRRWGSGGLVFDVETDEPIFALTFDDGPHPPYTEQVLDILAAHGARATFFIMGEQAERHPELLQRILDEGHEVANHFYGDWPTVLLTDDETIEAVERTEHILGDHNRAPRLVRPASALIRASQRRLLEERGYTVIIGSAYASDTTNPPAAYIRWAMKQMLEPGRIMVLHDGRRNRERTVAVLPGILEEAARLGLQPVTLADLLASSSEHPYTPGGAAV